MAAAGFRFPHNHMLYSTSYSAADATYNAHRKFRLALSGSGNKMGKYASDDALEVHKCAPKAATLITLNPDSQGRGPQAEPARSLALHGSWVPGWRAGGSYELAQS